MVPLYPIHFTCETTYSSVFGTLQLLFNLYLSGLFLAVSHRYHTGQSRCYSFSFHKNNKNKKHLKSYRRVHCQTEGFHVPVDVVDEEFLSDPCMLPHHCIPRKWTTTHGERFLYQRLQEVRKDPKFVESPVRRLWQDLLNAFPEMSHLTLQEVHQLMDEYRGPGYEKRRRRIAKPGLYIYDYKETIKKAFDNGLVALVTVGIHNLPPEALGEHGQLHTIHGVCNGGIDVPLVHVLTEKKNQKVYERILALVKQTHNN
ncbi:hypothetical protein Y032_0017g3305 [Ancylostoma ceylanicum]|uniref:Uncharacterized protein n=1 Tax=Ancylostoma ceylanicum TaxID=53326 RepID=A0A016V3V9_9BILA|nr:hypothetical protein Y032_0017g3305 [Ancylostoma ceylanicum]